MLKYQAAVRTHYYDITVDFQCKHFRMRKIHNFAFVKDNEIPLET